MDLRISCQQPIPQSQSSIRSSIDYQFSLFVVEWNWRSIVLAPKIGSRVAALTIAFSCGYTRRTIDVVQLVFLVKCVPVEENLIVGSGRIVCASCTQQGVNGQLAKHQNDY